MLERVTMSSAARVQFKSRADPNDAVYWRLTEAQADEALRMWGDGFDTCEIAAAFFVHESVVANHLARLP